MSHLLYAMPIEMKYVYSAVWLLIKLKSTVVYSDLHYSVQIRNGFCCIRTIIKKYLALDTVAAILHCLAHFVRKINRTLLWETFV